MSEATPDFLPFADAYDQGSNCCAAPTVYLVCDDDAGRQSLRSLIDSAGWHPQAFASSGEFLLRARPSSPSCLVLDASVPGLEGLLARLASDHIDTPMIFIIGDADVAMTVRVMKAGASEVLIKPFDNEALLKAIAQALERSRSSLLHGLEMRALRERYAGLSRRERQVLARVVLGRLNKQIAGELDISEITVKAHRGKMMRKMKARSVAQLVIMYDSIGDDSGG
ncbi:MAG TPA: LuxR C-terminal-related transcriptional regulator [Burkholderiales bacterium]|nr:LuxR C-terminal-related transcriptional regulator [Burkholderiales bacterium]